MNSIKKLLFIFLLFNGHNALAEYNGWYLKLEITTTSNEEIIGYVYRASAYLKEDSLNNESYVTRTLTQPLNPSEYMVYHEMLYRYEYTPVGAQEPYHNYALLGERSITTTEIRSIKILNRIDFSYLENVANVYLPSDTLWMNTLPVAKTMADGYLCSWQVFVHEETANTKKVLAELKAYSIKNEQQFKQLDEELENANGEYYREIEAKIEDLQDRLDGIASKILAKFEGEKVVIISFCSC